MRNLHRLFLFPDVGYVDDIALLAIGEDFEQTTAKLKNLMEKQGGGLAWSREHNS
jgi:hypothetical protein